jgi:LysM repeat protein
VARRAHGYDRLPMADRNLARVLAPLALLAAVIAIVVVVQVSDSSTPDSPSATQRPVTQRTSQRTPPVRRTPSVYVVKAGDTLTGIADKTGSTLDEILELNPDVDPQALQTGERLKLSP